MASLFHLILPLRRANRQNQDVNWFSTRANVLINVLMVRLGLEPEPFSPTQACKRRSTKQSHVLALSHVYPREEKNLFCSWTCMLNFTIEIKIVGLNVTTYHSKQRFLTNTMKKEMGFYLFQTSNCTEMRVNIVLNWESHLFPLV